MMHPLLLLFAVLVGQPKPDPKTVPQILVTTPLGVAVGTTTKVTIRGLRLDAASEVRCKEPGLTLKILGKGKVGVPNQQDPNKLGDTQVEVEVKVAADFKGDAANFVVATPQGTSMPIRFLIDAAPVLAEKEPNNGFRTAQPILIPQVVEGRISQPMDVDTYRIDGKQGQQLLLEVHAARHGSPLDSVLTLYDADGQEIASNDDVDGSTDSRLEVKLPRTGVFYVSVIDANDQGGPTHAYRLSVRLK